MPVMQVSADSDTPDKLAEPTKLPEPDAECVALCAEEASSGTRRRSVLRVRGRMQRPVEDPGPQAALTFKFEFKKFATK
jgi:hypothetical protein